MERASLQSWCASSTGAAERPVKAKAVAANAGYHAASAFSALKDGHPVAEVSIHKAADWRTVPRSWSRGTPCT